MKGLINLIVVAAMLLVGCNDDNSILEPTNDFADNTPLNKIDYNADFDHNDDDDDDGDYDWFFKKTCIVDGDKGAILYFYEEFFNEKGEYGRLNAVLNIPKGAFEGELTFNVEFSLENYSMKMYPTPFVFDKPLLLTIFFYNVDLDESAKDLDFAYIDGKGEEVNYKHKSIDIENGNIFVWDAELHHFSRYGWTRKKEIIKKDRLFVEK